MIERQNNMNYQYITGMCLLGVKVIQEDWAVSTDLTVINMARSFVLLETRFRLSDGNRDKVEMTR